MCYVTLNTDKYLDTVKKKPILKFIRPSVHLKWNSILWGLLEISFCKKKETQVTDVLKHEPKPCTRLPNMITNYSLRNCNDIIVKFCRLFLSTESTFIKCNWYWHKKSSASLLSLPLMLSSQNNMYMTLQTLLFFLFFFTYEIELILYS